MCSLAQAVHSSIVHSSADQWGPFTEIQAEGQGVAVQPESRIQGFQRNQA